MSRIRPIVSVDAHLCFQQKQTRLPAWSLRKAARWLSSSSASLGVTQVSPCPEARICKPFKEPGINSQPGADSIPRNRFMDSIKHWQTRELFWEMNNCFSSGIYFLARISSWQVFSFLGKNLRKPCAQYSKSGNPVQLLLLEDSGKNPFLVFLVSNPQF